MEYKISYDPEVAMNFQDETALKKFLNYLMRTDITQKWTGPLTRGNIYCLRNGEGKLEHFCNVSSPGQRQQAKALLMDTLKGVPVEALRSDIVHIEPNIPIGQSTEDFSDLVETTLPDYWKEHCPAKGQEDDYLPSTVALVLHVDQSYDGDALQHHIHRLYVTDSNLLKK